MMMMVVLRLHKICMTFFLLSVRIFQHISYLLETHSSEQSNSSAKDELLTVFCRLCFPLNKNTLFILSFSFSATVFDLFAERGKITREMKDMRRKIVVEDKKGIKEDKMCI